MNSIFIVMVTTLSAVYLVHGGENEFDNLTLLNHSISVSTNHTEPVVDPCTANLLAFSDSASNFTECLVLHSRPFRFCVGCVTHYTKAATIYIDLSNQKSDCHDFLLRSDRIQALSLVYKNMKDVWTNSDCASCFDRIEENHTTGEVDHNLTNDTLLFQEYYESFQTCLKPYVNESGPFESITKWQENNTACVMCKKNYSMLNDHFETIVSKTYEHVCMDIIDMMNHSRLAWGQELKCSHRKGPLAPVLGITFVMCMLPVFFYVSNRLFGAAQEKSIVTQKRLSKAVRDYGSDYGSYKNEGYSSAAST